MAVAGAWGRTEGASNWDSRLDVVPDGKVDHRDFGAVLGNLGCKGTTPSSPVPATGLTGPAGTSGGSGTPDSGTGVPSVIPLDVASSPGWAEFEDLTIVLINQRRAAGASCGGTWYGPVGPLGFNESIRTAARGHSSDMAEKGYFAHEGLDGSTPMQRMLDAGYNGTAFGENIAAGQRTPEEVVTAWMGSPGHCQNIMHPAFRVTGVGYIAAPASPYKHFWTQNFGN
ncbi:MAG: CAP domain-containing protein [Deltaproteobacteria bacterium]|nr:CAP domain-containing protein [Deltaproteobacteria bacterium]